MHGLILKSVQSFVSDTYGGQLWSDVVQVASVEPIEFEAMLSYDDALLPRVLNACAQVLGRPKSEILEDLGIYLVSNPKVEALRRLLRFTGGSFVDLLFSLDDLPERAQLAVTDLNLPQLSLVQNDQQNFSLRCGTEIPGFGHVMVGLLRAMADDYGDLVLLDHLGLDRGNEILSITLVQSAFADGRSFQLWAS